MKVAIIKYNAGNILSLVYALSRVGIKGEVTDDFNTIRKADRVIFPGVGQAQTTMHYLRERELDTLISELHQPVLGICLGQQLMCLKSEEGETGCIGIFGEEVLRFPAQGKVPHMGWNSLHSLKGPLFKGLDEGSFVYFVHSYYVPAGEYTSAVCHYMLDFSAAMQKDNFFATQFHPEKSGETGQLILQNFLNL